ncbi:MAG: 5-(carboxyamino)imidazole ribonucleotide mutase [Deltaproteobacteria bacterium RIFCSPHIGHO2_12_FULL_43_9]|nr:MAG: 5-(carboxyamino)imidazole ribonucleotide mutase [Deltaproteobacteria bacterium RIFCSPHIGHO2_12_FULL_43_9]
MKKVMVLMGSKSDLPAMEDTTGLLSELGIGFDVHIASAHRTPEYVRELVLSAPGRGIKVIIAAAGYAAHLAGVVAAHTNLPVIGVPLDSSSLQGFDALLSTAQMPGGVPVASMGIGRAGAVNAALFAAEILALSDEKLSKMLESYREAQRKRVLSADEELKK